MRTDIRVFLLLAGMAWPCVSMSQQEVPYLMVSGHVETITSARDGAVALARDGLIDEGLQILGELRKAHPEDRNLLYDETVVLGWAGRYAEAVANAADIDPGKAPDYVVEAVAKAHRNARDYVNAVEWYGVLADRNPGSVDARAGQAMSHADAGDFTAARQALETVPASEANIVGLLLAEAYIREREGRLLEALAHYQRVLDIEPDNDEALRGKALVLRTALLPREALALARQKPGLLSDDEIVQLEADVAALQIRYGAQTSYPTSRRFEGTDRALSKIDALLESDDLAPAVRERLSFDRIVALSDRLRMTEVIQEFEDTDIDIDEVPVYVLISVAKAYLFERQPEIARHFLELARERQPGNIDIEFQLFFVYADLQEHELALELAESMLDNFSATNQVPGSSVTKGSAPYLRAAILVGLAHAYGDQLVESQRHFEKLLADLPHNTDVRQELANVYRWRGWLDRSLAEYSQVLAVEPESVSARIGKAHLLLDNRDYASFDHELQLLTAEYAFEPAVQRLAERWDTHNQQALSIDSNFGESSGDTFGQDQFVIDAVWYSKPLAYRYRAFLLTHDAFAEFPEGSARRKRAGAGVEYRHKRWLASTALSLDRDGGSAGLRGRVAYRFNDFFELAGRLETDSDSMSLRGHRVGVSSDLVALDATYARHESTVIRAALNFQDYSDGNAARSVYVGAEQRLINDHSYKLTLLGDAFAENRRRDDVAYFSPRNAVSWGVGLRNEWTMYRRYDFSLAHSLTGRAGRYDQAGYDAATTWLAEYRFRIDVDARWNAYIGLIRNSNVYDGAREYATFVMLGLGGRF
jgi:biofilm PGA synthesis protein PgaA